MKTISIRGLDDQLAEKLKQRAQKEAKSVNQFVIDSIKKSLGGEKTKRFTVEYDDMDDLFGKWTQQEFETIQGKIDADRKIDQELWR